MCLAAPVLAQLGGNSDSITVDSIEFKGAVVRTSMLLFDRHDITTASGTRVHEYVSRSGQVFAVSWQGPRPPNLRQLFGSYFDSFVSAAAAQSHPGGHRQVNLAQGDFVIQAVARLRSFRGKAYVPSLVPAGVAAGELE
jgi:hypothetical protein